MATFERYKNAYRVRFSFDGKRYSKAVKNKSEGKRWVEEKTKELQSLVELQTAKNTAFSNLLKKYANLKLSSEKRRKSFIRVMSFIRDNPDLVSKDVYSVKKTDLRDWMTKRLSEVSGASVSKEMSLLSQVFKLGINELDINIDNPLSGLPRPKSSPPRERYIKDHEIEIMLVNMGYTSDIALDLVKLRVAAAFLFSLETAMRAGEICNLEWDDISPSGLVLKVKTAKTRSGIREVPLSSRARKIIEQCKLENDTPKVFRLTTAQLDANFRKYRKEAKLKGFTFHDSRATAITRLAKKLDILDLAKMVGHKDPKMLMVYYRQGAEALVDRLG